MSVRLPSDLIVDVMRNAPPASRAAATARLQSIGGQADVAFTQTLARTSHAPSAPQPGPQQPGEAYHGFERMVLRSLYESILPGEESGVFGAAPSAGIWRSMMADQLAGAQAKSGGIGIAAMLASARQDGAPAADWQWPYFRMERLDGFAG